MPPEPLPELSAVTVAEVHAVPNQPIRADTLPRQALVTAAAAMQVAIV